MSTGRDLVDSVRKALLRREGLFGRLHSEHTDCYRVLHGVAEGQPGVAIDRYGPLLLIQTWPQATASCRDISAAADLVARHLGVPLVPVHRRRGAADGTSAAIADPERSTRWDRLVEEAPGYEMGILYDVSLMPARPDPLLFLDLRAGRRRLAGRVQGRSVLNFFAYTCSAGVCAAVRGASEVWNVDWSRSALEIGTANASRNGVGPDRFRVVCEDFFPAARQLAGLAVKGRASRTRSYLKLEAREFDVVILDPPPWSSGPHGAVDVVRDYESLFKPALLATSPGGHILATNHSPQVKRDAWLTRLERCAAKARRVLTEMQTIAPEDDFPSPDGRPLLKMAWIGVADGPSAD